MDYKSGEGPQINDEVLGEIDGRPARGRVLAVRANGNVLVTRRAAYSGSAKPLVAEHHEVPAENFSLVYRPVRSGAAPAGRPSPAAVVEAKKAKTVVKAPVAAGEKKK